jgi:hypothetical protein
MNKEKSPAKLAVIQEWDEWSKTHADSTGGFLFFQYLQRRRPDLLLDFKTRGDSGRSFTSGC